MVSEEAKLMIRVTRYKYKFLFFSIAALLAGPVAVFASHDLGVDARLFGASIPFPLASLLAGAFAAIVMTLVIFLLRGVIGIHMNIPAMLGTMIAADASLPWRIRIGTLAHLVMGSLWGLIFGFLLDFHIFFQELTMGNGILFGLFAWILMMCVVMPFGEYGFFGLKRDWRIPFATFVGHIAYGITLVILLPLIFLA